MVKQSFSFQWRDDRIFGCSFRKANYQDIYFGHITQYPNREAYNHYDFIRHQLIEYTNIPLADNKLDSATNLDELREASRWLLKKIIPYILQ